LRIAYVTDQFLPADATDTIQLVTMSAAFGEVGADLRLLYPCIGRQSDAAEPTAAARTLAERAEAHRIANHYGVKPYFEAVPLEGPYPAPLGLRGLEKLSHAANSTRLLANEIAAKDGADIVYTRNLPIVLAALANTRLPVFYETYRPWPMQSRAKRVLFASLRNSPRFAGLILHSELAAASYRDMGYEPERLLVAHNGVEAGRFAEGTSKFEARRSLGLDRPPIAGRDAQRAIKTERPIVLYAGQVAPGKGIGILLDAAERLARVDFVIVGSRGDGPIEQRAAKMANVRIVSWQSPALVERWLAAADIVVIPPTRGPLEKVGNTVLPIKTFQYLASGRAIIAPRMPDLIEVLEDGHNARLVRPDDLEDFITAIDELVRNPVLADELGATARREGLANTWQARADKVLSFIGRRCPRFAHTQIVPPRGARPLRRPKTDTRLLEAAGHP